MAETGGLYIVDFESGDLTGFDSTTVTTGNSISAASAAAHEGSYGAEIELGGTDDFAYGSNTLSSSQTTLYARVYVYFPDNDYLLNGSPEDWYLFQLYDDSRETWSVALELRSTATGVDQYRMRYADNSSQYNNDVTSHGTEISLDTWHYIELGFVQGNGDGSVRAWVDGTLVNEATGLTNTDMDVESVRVGSISGASNGASGEYIYIDDIKADTSQVGAYVDAGGSAVVPVGSAIFNSPVFGGILVS